MRGPVRRRINELPASGKVKVRTSAKISATSGTWIKPPSPTTSTGKPACRRACSTSGIYRRLRTSTAKVCKSSSAIALRSRANQAFLKYSAIAPASCERDSYWPTATSPLPAFGLNFNLATFVTLLPIFAPTSAIKSIEALARSKIFSSFRQVVSRVFSSHLLSEPEVKWRANVASVSELADLQP